MGKMPRRRSSKTRIQLEIEDLKRRDKRPRAIIIIDVLLFVRTLDLVWIALVFYLPDICYRLSDSSLPEC